ncbi:MAG: hypothetical protein AAGI49_13220 [Bacteroidota bacterium]
MGLRMYCTFISNHGSQPNKEVLEQLEFTTLSPSGCFDFYEANKQYEQVFIGSHNNCKVICNGDFAEEAFRKNFHNNPLTKLVNCEVGVIQWDETCDVFGFCLFEDAILKRAVLSTDGVMDSIFGTPIEEELSFHESEHYLEDMQVEKEDIIKYEGEEAWQTFVNAESIHFATDQLVKRFLGVPFTALEGFEVEKYR